MSNILNTYDPKNPNIRSNLLRRINISTLKKIIKEFSIINYEEVEFDEVQEALNVLMEGYAIKLFGLKPSSVFRTRISKDGSDFTNVSELIYTPESKRRLGRLNDLQKSIFYCSTNMNVSLLEVNPKIGDIVYFIECSLKKDIDLRLLPIGMKKYSQSNISKNKKLKDLPYENEIDHSTFSNPIDKDKNDLIHEFLVNQLTKKVTHYKEYYPTIAFSNITLNDLNNIDGIAYPSVASNINGINLALKSKIVDKNLKFENVFKILIEKQISPNDYIGRKYDATIITETGNIEWNN